MLIIVIFSTGLSTAETPGQASGPSPQPSEVSSGVSSAGPSRLSIPWPSDGTTNPAQPGKHIESLLDNFLYAKHIFWIDQVF